MQRAHANHLNKAGLEVYAQGNRQALFSLRNDHIRSILDHRICRTSTIITRTPEQRGEMIPKMWKMWGRKEYLLKVQRVKSWSQLCNKQAYDLDPALQPHPTPALATIILRHCVSLRNKELH